MTRLFAMLLLSALSLGACANPAAGDKTPGNFSYQFIIQFRTPVEAPPKADFLQQLSKDAGANLLFVRAMVTGAQIYGVRNIDRVTFDTLLHRLRLRHDVLYVEEDRRVEPADNKK